ncbi:MAG: LON peptidase substrate-binding domain-containing protein [Arenicellales bacterium]
MRNRFSIEANEASTLPDILPVFPLTGAVILPNGQLPLNIFETRYLDMVLDSLSHSRLIGMVQPKPSASEDEFDLHQTGCAGRIVSFSETRDDRLLIILAGVCRFDIETEIDLAPGGYRRMKVSWTRFLHALDDLDQESPQLDPSTLLASAKRYTDHRQLAVDWKALDHLQPSELIDTLASSLPFSPEEKQGLVEAVVMNDRLQLLTALCEFGAVSTDSSSPIAH